MKKILCFLLIVSMFTMPASAAAYVRAKKGDTLVGITVSHGASLAAVKKSNPQFSSLKSIPEGSLVVVPYTSAQTKAMEREVIRLINVERRAHGLSPLRKGVAIANVARIKSKDMRDQKYFDHNSPNYGTPFQMMKQFGVRYKHAGENIASGQQTAKEVVEAWMNSAGHRANILNPDFHKIGVGCCDDAKGPYWVQMFTD